jgi:hypothetical protein
VLTGCCTLIGTSTNLLVDDMARIAGEPRFGNFEITPVGVPVALVGGLYLFLFSGRLMRRSVEEPMPKASARVDVVEHARRAIEDLHAGGVQVGHAEVFAEPRPSSTVGAKLSWSATSALWRSSGVTSRRVPRSKSHTW